MSRQLANIGAILAASPLLGELVSSHNTFKESAWPHRSADLEISKVISEIKQPVSKFDAGHIFADVNGFSLKLLSTHSRSPRYAEQQGIWAEMVPLGKPLNGLTKTVRLMVLA